VGDDSSARVSDYRTDVQDVDGLKHQLGSTLVQVLQGWPGRSGARFLAPPIAADQRSRRPLSSALRVVTDFVRILLGLGRHRRNPIYVRSVPQRNSDNVGHALNEVTR
jgi:hypothetical protein